MIEFILSIFDKHFSREFVEGLTDDNLEGLYKEAYRYSEWGL